MLPERDREAIELTYFGGLTWKEAAERLGVPHGSLKTRIHRSLEALRGMLA